MLDVIARWIARGLSLLVLGPVAVWGAGMAAAPDGSDAHTLLTGSSFGTSLIALGIVAGCAVAAAGLSARLADRHEAVLNTGFVLGWVAWTGGRMSEVIRLAPDTATLLKVAVEAAVLLTVVVFSWLVADRLSRRSSTSEGLALGVHDILGMVRTKSGMPVLLTSLVAALVCAWLFGRHDRPGQAIAAAFLGGVAAGVFGMLVYQSVMKDSQDASREVGAVFVPASLGVMLAGLVGMLGGLVFPGTGRLPLGITQGSLPGWVVVTPCAWAVGALVGVPAGISFLHSKSHAAASDAEGRRTPSGAGA